MMHEFKGFPENETPPAVNSDQHEINKILFGVNREEMLQEVENVSLLPADINDRKELLAPNKKPSNLSEAQWKMVRTKSFKEVFGDWEAVAGRDECKTPDILNDIIENTSEENLKEVALLLLSNEEIINRSTILRGQTSNGQGIGQSILQGSLEDIRPQVYVVRGELEHVGMFKFELRPMEEVDREKFNRTVLHELLHSFTTYIIRMFKDDKEELLTQQERDFYNNVYVMHQEFLKSNKIGDGYLDGLSEYIVKAMTSEPVENGQFDQEQFKLVFGEFKKMWESNTRMIRSISATVSHLVDENGEPSKKLMEKF